MRPGSETAQRTWRTLTPEQKRLRLDDLRRRQLADLEAEARRLSVILG